MQIRAPLITGFFLLSLGSCLSSFKEKVLSFVPGKQNESAQRAQSQDQAQQNRQPAPNLEVNTGKNIIQSGAPHFDFIQRASKSMCPNGIATRVLYFSSTTAVMTREDCRDIEPKTLPQKSFHLAPFDDFILIYRDKVHDREVAHSPETAALCSGGADSAGRQISATVKKHANKSLTVLLRIKGSTPLETLEFPVTIAKKEQLTLYQVGQPERPPYIALAIGNFNGLTGFASYNAFAPAMSAKQGGERPSVTPALASGLLPQNRKETNISLPHCFLP